MRRLARVFGVAGIAIALSSSASAHVCDAPRGMGQQIEAYCAAAETAKEAKKGQEAVSGVQAGVTAICATACALSFTTMGSMEGVCNVASIGGAVFGFIKVKEVSQKMQGAMSLAGTAMSVMNNDMSTAFEFRNPLSSQTGDAATKFSGQAGAEAAGVKAEAAYFKDNGIDPSKASSEQIAEAKNAGQEAANKERSHASCVTAATAGLSAFMSKEGADSSEDAYKQNRANAESLDSQVRSSMSSGKVAAKAGGGTPGSTGQIAQNKLGGNSMSKDKRMSEGSNPCNRPGFDGMVQCALAQPGNNLPPFVASPQFKQTLEKISGLPADRLASLKNPGAMIQAGMGRVLTNQGQERMASVLGDMKNAVAGAVQTSGAYVGGGRGGSVGGGESEMPDLNALMDKFIPKNGEGEERQDGAGELAFEGERNLGSQPGDEEDRRLSLFSRVSNRYRINRGRLTTRQYILEGNQILNQGR